MPTGRYVGRPGPFGNPFSVAKYGQEGAVAQHREWLHQPEQTEFRDRVRRELVGSDLICWCGEGTACHADVLLEVANQ